MKYRAEIDGLRALAVIPVVLFHSGSSAFSGGYVGVDVFFVISGFLITSILLEDYSNGGISLLTFYERRARRILPALFTVMVLSLVAGFVWLPAASYLDLARSELAVLAFVSNVYFYLETNYFATAAEEKPMLHTWSLAVEEQFYVVFPLLLALLLRLNLRRRTQCVFLVVIGALSLSLAHIMSWRHGAANFFLIPTRAWELIAGALLALLPAKQEVGARPVDGIASITGLVLLGFANIFFDRQTPYPGLPTLVPVIGTALIIKFGIPGTFTARLLSIRPLVGIGLISYSMYLWHQPLLAILRAKTVGSPSGLTIAAILLICLALASLSFRFVESPFRDRRHLTAKQVGTLSAIGAFAIGCACLAIILDKGMPTRFTVPDYGPTMQASSSRAKCHTEGLKYLPPATACRTLDLPPTWAVFGDSHTVELAESIGEQLSKRGESVLRLSFSGCPPAWNFEARQPGCSAWTREAINHLATDSKIRTVVIGYRHAAYLFGNQLAAFPGIPNDQPTHLHKGIESKPPVTEAREIYWKSFFAMIEQLQKVGKTVIVVYPVPELPADVHKLLSQKSIFTSHPMTNGSKVAERKYFDTRQRSVLEKLDGMPWGKTLHRVKPHELFCDAAHCKAVINGESLYFDDNHLSLAGARHVAQLIVNAL